MNSIVSAGENTPQSINTPHDAFQLPELPLHIPISHRLAVIPPHGQEHSSPANSLDGMVGSSINRPQRGRDVLIERPIDCRAEIDEPGFTQMRTIEQLRGELDEPRVQPG